MPDRRASPDEASSRRPARCSYAEHASHVLQLGRHPLLGDAVRAGQLPRSDPARRPERDSKRGQPGHRGAEWPGPLGSYRRS